MKILNERQIHTKWVIPTESEFDWDKCSKQVKIDRLMLKVGLKNKTDYMSMLKKLRKERYSWIEKYAKLHTTSLNE